MKNAAIRAFAARAHAAQAIVLLTCAVFTAGCSTLKRPVTHGPDFAEGPSISIGGLIERSYNAATLHTGGTPPAAFCRRDYAKALLADGRLTIGLGIGTRDLGAVSVPRDPSNRTSVQTLVLCGKPVRVEGRLIVTNSDFHTALAECEIIFVTSHSRFGAGPAFLLDGKAAPYKMQRTEGYEIVMPDYEVDGYAGDIKRTFSRQYDTRPYTVFEPDSSDLDAASPLHGYQLLVLSTCSSKKHFYDEILEFRRGFPTAAIFTTRPCCMDPEMGVFVRLLFELFRGNSLEEAVSGMNEEYRRTAWNHVRRRIRPWRVIDNLYVLGIHGVP